MRVSLIKPERREVTQELDLKGEDEDKEEEGDLPARSLKRKLPWSETNA